MLSSLLNPSFWFDLTPVRMGPLFEAIFFVAFALCVIGGAVLRMILRNRDWDKYQAVVISRLARTASTSGLAGFFLLFFAFEEVQFFGARFWMALWVIGVIVALVMIYRYQKRFVPQMRIREQSRAAVNKYLPRRGR